MLKVDKYMKMPFMFRRIREDSVTHSITDKFVVVIALPFDYTHTDTGWMHDPYLPNGLTLRPTIDLREEVREFDTEKEMMDFVADWWIEWKKGD